LHRFKVYSIGVDTRSGPALKEFLVIKKNFPTKKNVERRNFFFFFFACILYLGVRFKVLLVYVGAKNNNLAKGLNLVVGR